MKEIVGLRVNAFKWAIAIGRIANEFRDSILRGRGRVHTRIREPRSRINSCSVKPIQR